MIYTVQKDLRPTRLAGLSEDQIDQHWALYEGYVKNVNALVEGLKKEKAGSTAWSERKRRLGYEFDGMVLHELYFGNLGQGAAGDPGRELGGRLATDWGSIERWREDFSATGMMRGVGWAILYHDPVADRLFNWWIGDHELFHPVSFQPLLVMDVWEHAYMVDYGASGRKDYVDAFLDNVRWDAVRQRFEESRARRIANRYEPVAAGS